MSKLSVIPSKAFKSTILRKRRGRVWVFSHAREDKTNDKLPELVEEEPANFPSDPAD